eukprot:UN04052
MSKRKTPPAAALHEDSSDSEGEDSFDVMEFAALQHGNDDVINGIKRLQEKRGGINNQNGILQKIEEVSLPRDWPWIETMMITNPKPMPINNLEDDLEREAEFYKSATGAVKVALIQLEMSKVPYKRPTDYYAESVKPDSHMAKVKQVLLNEKKRVQEMEERKHQRETKKFQKSVYAERLKEKALKKRATLEKVEQLKRKTKGTNAQ